MKLMGRSSGFIAMHASLASGQIDICLIPEVYVIKIGQNSQFCHTDKLIQLFAAVQRFLSIYMGNVEF